MHKIVLPFIIGIVLLTPLAYSLELDPGECLTINSTEICAKNETIDIKRYCYDWLLENVTVSYGNISHDLDVMHDLIYDYNQDLRADFNDTIDDMWVVLDSVKKLENYTSCVDRISDISVTLQVRNNELSKCSDEKKSAESYLKSELETCSSNLYTYVALAFVGGVVVYYIITKKVVPMSKGFQDRESPRGY